MARTFGNRFNRLYNNEYFPEPYAFSFGESLVKIPGLDGKGKMGKSESEGNAIFLSDTPEAIRKKVMRAVTDGGPTRKPTKTAGNSKPVRFDEGSIYARYLAHFDNLYNSMNIRYGDLKKQLAEDMIIATQPIREKINDIANDAPYLRQVALYGAAKARESAQKPSGK
jgi:tryptophanyl-tRNA synthetase